MTANAGILGICSRVAGAKWGGVLLGVPLENVQDLAVWGCGDDDVGCCEAQTHDQRWRVIGQTGVGKGFQRPQQRSREYQAGQHSSCQNEVPKGTLA